MVRVAKKGGFAHFEGLCPETKRARRSRFVAFDRSRRDLGARQFLLRSVSKHGQEEGRTNTLFYIYLSILYTLAVSPSLGGSRQHKRNHKNNGDFTLFFRQ